MTVTCSLLIGLYCGLNKVTEQVATETGMVLAGMVNYSPDTPFYLYNIKVFALINQLSALLVWITGSPVFVNIFTSALLGAISCMALCLMIYAFSRNAYISIAGLLTIIALNMIRPGIVYPIWLYGMCHTYGILGLSFMVLTAALYGCRKYKWALICTGLAPSVHPSWGVFLALILTAAGLINIKFCWLLAKKYWKYFAIGFGISILALILQMYWMRVLPTIDPEQKKLYLDNFIRYWDCHRQPLNFTHRSIWVAACSAVTAIIGLLTLKFRSGTRFLLTALSAAGIFGFIGAYISHLPYDKVPLYVLMFMPGRYLNLSILVFPALAVGLLFSRNLYRRPWSLLVYAGVLYFWYVKYSFLAFLNWQMLRYSLGLFDVFAVAFDILLTMTIILGITRYCMKKKIHPLTILKFIRKQVNYPEAKKTLLVLLAIFFLFPVLCYFTRSLINGNLLPSFYSSPTEKTSEFYARIAKDKGVLLNTPENYLISLKTKRPVWFDMGALDGFPMVPECAGKFNPGLQEIYGVSLLEKPGDKFCNQGVLPSEIHRTLWESRSRQEWRNLAKKYNFTGIIVPYSWKLQLNRAAELIEGPESEENCGISAYYTLKK